MTATEFYPMLIGIILGVTLFNTIMVLILTFMLKEYEKRIKRLENGK